MARWIDLDSDERKELADLLWHAADVEASENTLQESAGLDAERRTEARMYALAERVEDTAVPLTVADIRAALRYIPYQGGLGPRKERAERIAIILRARCVNDQRKVNANKE